MQDLGFLAAGDIRFVATVHAIERELRHGHFIYRFVGEDDFGEPENAFLACTFWYINALAAIGREPEARALFEHVLTCRNSHGVLAEHIDPVSLEQWGNFVQTYSIIRLISSALRLSIPWERILTPTVARCLSPDRPRRASFEVFGRDTVFLRCVAPAVSVTVG